MWSNRGVKVLYISTVRIADVLKISATTEAELVELFRKTVLDDEDATVIQRFRNSKDRRMALASRVMQRLLISSFSQLHPKDEVCIRRDVTTGYKPVWIPPDTHKRAQSDSRRWPVGDSNTTWALRSRMNQIPKTSNLEFRSAHIDCSLPAQTSQDEILETQTDPPCDLQYSVSHDNDMLAIAVAADPTLIIGVDLMKVALRNPARPLSDFFATMNPVFDQTEWDYILGEVATASGKSATANISLSSSLSSRQSSDPPVEPHCHTVSINQEAGFDNNYYSKLRRFYQLWTMKESFIKAIGTGLYTDPARLRCDMSLNVPTLYLDGTLLQNFSFHFLDKPQLVHYPNWPNLISFDQLCHKNQSQRENIFNPSDPTETVLATEAGASTFSVTHCLDDEFVVCLCLGHNLDTVAQHGSLEKRASALLENTRKQSERSKRFENESSKIQYATNIECFAIDLASAILDIINQNATSVI